ncbi:MAG: 23S rRNA (pseudouridine(1915)-N(3))-methyltransferase RlmH [Helicobacteraceae bacterium]|jgi:23S rRNA (pseudouridine1915-N3)-methyltransferase|nr:23S rRNA (pseudouridine(1915)-N(3))-methyltransferase RlmH [Helicobacteraceae bacterium]
MAVELHFIGKGGGIFKEAESHYEKLIRSFAPITIKPARIGAGQGDPKKERAKYTEAFEPFLAGGAFKIALDANGDRLNSESFAKIIANRAATKFFIGGAFGFESEFLARCDQAISLSPLTFSHEIARVALLEQIYRALSINAAHPYHK